MTVKFTSKRPLTDGEEAEIQEMIAKDPDNPEITDDQASRGKPFGEAFPDLAESIKRSRGRPRKKHARQAVTLRLDPRVVERFKAGGDDWRNRMVEAIEKAG